MTAVARTRPGLLVSVRDADEAKAALAGGADIVDVKDPARGSLGAASAAVIARVVRVVAGRRPVSAAMGELREWRSVPELLPTGLAWIKFGLAGLAPDSAWENHLLTLREQFESSMGPQVVAVAYADWQRAAAPPIAKVVALAVRCRFAALLFDTHIKDGSTLLDCLPVRALEDWTGALRQARVPVAYAGSIGAAEMRTLMPLRPSWFAVRGSACRGGRAGRVCTDRVRSLAALLEGES